MNSEFLRMQKLAGIKPVQEDYNEIVGILTEVYLHNHYYSKGILKEDINEINLKGIANKIKDKFSKLPLKAKQSTKKIVDAIKSTGFNPVEIIGDASKTKKEDIKKALDSIRATQTLNLAKKLQEAEGDKTAPEFTDINQLKDLKPGDSFIWKGEADPNAKWNGDKITINAALDKFGLKPNIEYIVQPPSVIMLGPDGEEKPTEVPAQIWAKKEVEYLASMKGGSKIMEFFRYIGNKLGGKIALGLFGAISVFGGATGQSFSILANTDLQSFYDTGALASADTQGMVDTINQAAEDLINNVDNEGGNEINKQLPTSGTPYNTEINDSEVIRSLDQNGVDTQGIEVTDNTATTQTYETGEGKLDEAGIEKSANELAEKTIDDLNDQLENNKGKNLTKVSLKIKYGAAVSHNQGDDSNVSNDGKDLLNQRLESSEKVAKLAAQKVQDIVKKTYGGDIDIDISFTEVDTHDGIDDQKIQKAKDFLETQSSFQSSESDIDISEKEGKPIKLLYFQFLAEPDKLDPNILPTSKKSKEQDNKPETSQDTPPPVPTDSGMDKDITTLPSLSRNNQIALLLSRTNPSLSLYKALGLDNVVNIPDGDYNSIATRGTYKGEPASDNAKKLAKIIIYLRQKPDVLIKAYGKLTDLKLGQKRAKASITTGAKGKSTSAPIRENLSLLVEAAIDNLISNSKPTDINQAAFLAKLINVMYVGEEGGNVLDPDSHNDPDFKPTYDKIKTPLGSKEKGERYVYLDKKQGVKIQPDITRIDKAIEADKPLMTVLSRINTQDELASLLTALFIHRDKKGQSIFPDDKTFTADSGKVRSALFGLNYRLKEAEEEELPFDVKDFYSRIDKSPNLKAALSKINSLEEFYQFILYTIFPRINKSLIQDKTKLKAAIAKAANASKQFAEKGKYNVDENLIKEESTQYNTEGLLLTNTEVRPQKDILSDIRSITGVTIVSSKDYKLAGEESTAFSNPNYYSIIRIKIDPHPYPGGFKDKDLDKMLTDIRAIKGVRNFKLTKSVEKTTV